MRVDRPGESGARHGHDPPDVVAHGRTPAARRLPKPKPREPLGKTAAPGANPPQSRLSSAHRSLERISRDALGLLMGQAKIALECVECRKEAGEIAPGWLTSSATRTSKAMKKSWSTVLTARGESSARFDSGSEVEDAD